MAKKLNQQRKQELINSLNEKRDNIAQKTDSLQQSVAPRSQRATEQTGGDPAAWLKSRPKQNNLGKMQANLSAIPFLGNAARGGDLLAKLPSNFIKKETAKPILIGLGASVVIMALLKSRKRAKTRKAEKLASMQAATKPAIGFLLLKTLLSIAQPALKQVVKNKIRK